MKLYILQCIAQMQQYECWMFSESQTIYQTVEALFTYTQVISSWSFPVLPIQTEQKTQISMLNKLF